MNDHLAAFMFSLGVVVLAEMGDKTQLLAMAFATKYKASKVMLGVFIATVLNHALAVAAGNYITRFDFIQTWIQAIAALSFIIFGLWTIRGDKLEGEENRTTKYGAVVTVAIAFFIAEMGDKTQLATIAIATKYPAAPIAVLFGTTIGMLIADGFGIIVGIVLRKRIPERTVKLVAATVFVAFGLAMTYEVARDSFDFSMMAAILILIALSSVTALVAFFIIKKEHETTNEIQ
jgi:putative Ca2+/H+ antiporter (TMEM165/GDT1 family)